jgi:hypothetical protein
VLLTFLLVRTGGHISSNFAFASSVPVSSKGLISTSEKSLFTGYIGKGLRAPLNQAYPSRNASLVFVVYYWYKNNIYLCFLELDGCLDAVPVDACET